MEKKKLGQIAYEHSKKAHDTTDPRDIQQAQEQDYKKQLEFAVQHARKKVSCEGMPKHDKCGDNIPLEGDFYIEVISITDSILTNVIKNYFVPRKTCPTPCFDQTVYKFDSNREDIFYIWTVPDKEICYEFIHNPDKVHPKEKELAKMIFMYFNGELLRLAKKFNGEKDQPGIVLEGHNPKEGVYTI